MQDILALSEGARMNTPAKAEENWAWRMRGECVNDWLAEIIYKKTALYRRVPESAEKKAK
jgi:4-alpha-glucanotransferase